MAKGYSTDKKFYNTQEAVSKLPSYRDLDESNLIRQQVDLLLANLDYTNIENIRQFGNDGTNPLIQEITDSYESPHFTDHVSASIIKIVGHKIQQVATTKLEHSLTKIDVKAGEAYRTTEGFIGKTWARLFNKETPAQTRAREARENLIDVSVGVSANEAKLDATIETSAHLKDILGEKFGVYDQLKAHLVTVCIALDEGNKRMHEDTDFVNETDPLIVSTHESTFAQKLGNTVETLIAASTNQVNVFTSMRVVGDTLDYFQHHRDSVKPMNTATLGVANTAVEMTQLVALRRKAQDNQINMLEATTDVVGASVALITESSSPQTLLDRAERYNQVSQGANKHIHDLFTTMTNARAALTAGTAKMLAVANSENAVGVTALLPANGQTPQTVRQEQPKQLNNG